MENYYRLKITEHNDGTFYAYCKKTKQHFHGNSSQDLWNNIKLTLNATRKHKRKGFWIVRTDSIEQKNENKVNTDKKTTNKKSNK